eukprot:gene14270-16844_t
MLSRLQIYSLELNISLETRSSDSLLYVPKAVREIDRVRKEALQLKARVKSINSAIEQMHAKTSTTVATIAKLDTVRTRIDQCTRSLAEAEKLLSFSAQADALFASPDLGKIADTLDGVKQSLSVLSDIPEFREQSRLFPAHQDRLEQLVRPQLAAALAARDVAACTSLLRVFASMKRETSFFSHYYASRLEPLKASWATYKASSPLASYLQAFFSEVSALVRHEGEFVAALDQNRHSHVLQQLVIHLFTAINPQMQSRVEQAIANKPCTELISLYKTTTNFLSTLALPGDNDLLVKSVLEPFNHLQPRYPDYESRMLKSQISSLVVTKKGDFIGTIKNVEAAINKLFPMLDGAIERYYEFTHVTEIDPFVHSLSTVIKEFTGMLKDGLSEMKVVSNISAPATEFVPLDQQRQRMLLQQQQQAKQSAQQQQQLNWEYFQGAMKLLQHANTLASRMKALEQKMTVNIVQYLSAPKDPLETSIRKILLGDHLKQHRLQTTISQIAGSPQLTGGNNTTNRKSLFHEAHDCISSFYGLCQHYIFETMVTFIRNKLKEVPKMPEWKQQISSNDYQSTPSPISYSTQIADHLLTIPQQLDPYSEEESLRFSYQIALAFPTSDHFYQNLVKELHKPTTLATVDSSSNQEEDEDDEAADGMAHQWITLVSSATERLYLDSIVEITTLTEYGCQQLAVDIGYLFNVLRALGVSPNVLLSKIQDFVSLPKDK